MAPDINSLPPSPSPRASNVSLQAAATMNAQLQSESSRRNSNSSQLGRNPPNPAIPPSPQAMRAERRRSSVLMNLSINDPAIPGPGEMQPGEGRAGIFGSISPGSLGGSPVIAQGDPHHQRAPSLGEIHQEIEQEQEAQVNRLLQMIRQQQHQLNLLQSASGTAPPPAIDDSTPTSERSLSFPPPPTAPIPHSTSSIPRTRSPGLPNRPSSTSQSSISAIRSLSRESSRRSRRSSRGPSSPAPRATSTSIGLGDDTAWALPAQGRDEAAFYQAETQMLVRENQMLKLRIRELERLVAEGREGSGSAEPTTPSNLVSATPLRESEQGPEAKESAA